MEPSELFFGFCRYFSSLGLDDDVPWSTWTQRSLSYFDQLGRMLGYKTNTEDALTDSDGWRCPKSLQGKRIDLVWFYPDKNEYALSLEHQGSNSPRKINLDIRKLAVIQGLKVLVVYRQNTLKIQKSAAKEVSKIEDQEGSFLLLNVPNYFRDRSPIEKLETRLINERGRLVAVGTAEARKENITGLRFFAKPEWVSKRR